MVVLLSMYNFLSKSSGRLKIPASAHSAR